MVQVTEKAAQVIAQIREQEEIEAPFLRFMVSQGGCKDYQYGIGFSEDKESSDHEFESNGIRVLVDPESLKVLDGCIIGYDEDDPDNFKGRLEEGFQIFNPNARGSCGCGKSFDG